MSWSMGIIVNGCVPCFLDLFALEFEVMSPLSNRDSGLSKRSLSPRSIARELVAHQDSRINVHTDQLSL